MWCTTTEDRNMRVFHSLIFFFLTLWEGSTAHFDTDIGVRTGTVGAQITVGCTFNFSGRRRIFCRCGCDDGDILVETLSVSNQSGRYSIQYEEGSFPATYHLMYVRITNLTKSDSGRYRCWLDRSLSLDSTAMFELIVKDAPTTTKPNWTLKPFSAPAPSASPQAAASSASDSLLLVRLVVVIVVIVSSSAVLTFCWRKRTSKPEDPHVELDHVNVTEVDQVYEEVGEDERRGRSPPEETSDL